MDHSTEMEGVEPEGIAATSILGMFAGIVVVLALVVVAGVEIALNSFATAELDAVETTGYPLLRETQAMGQALLSSSGAVSDQPGVYRLPIEQAMAEIVLSSGPGTTSEVTLRR